MSELMSFPPPNRAIFETDVAARPPRETLRLAVVHTPEVLLKISTALEHTPELLNPPPNRARFETDVAARYHRATLRVAVVHTPVMLLKISTVL